MPYIAVGAAGNAWITASIYELLTGIIDYGLSPQEAIESPRFLVNRKRFLDDGPPIPGRVRYEQGIEGRVIREMRARGHQLEPIGLKGELVMGYAAVALVDLENGEVIAGADPRRSHQAAGLR